MSEAIKDREDLTVFVSYKYSEAKETKDKILGALGKSGLHYEGWIAENPNDNSSFYARTAKDNLAVDILEAADVVVVVLSLVLYKEYSKRKKLETEVFNFQTLCDLIHYPIWFKTKNLKLTWVNNLKLKI